MIPTRQTFAQHRESILRYWERARDNQEGGFHAWILPDGTLWKHRARSAMIHGRLLYNYSEGMLAGLAFCADHAAHIYDYVTRDLRAPGGWYAGRYEGELRGAEVLDTYDNLFVVIGMARYAQASGRADVAAEVWRLFRLIEEIAIKGDLTRDGVVGGQSRPFGRSSTSASYTGNSNLHYLEALTCLRDAGIGGDLVPRARAVREFFLLRILDQREMVVFDKFDEGFERPVRTPGAYTSLAHGLEWIDFFRCIPGVALDEPIEKALLAKAIEHGVMDDGLMQDNYYLAEKRTAGGAMFWPQVESVKTFNRASELYGGQYAEIARRLAAYYFEHFVDADGGVFYQLDRNGVVTDRNKGGFWKCDYHSMRMCVDAAARAGGAFA